MCTVALAPPRDTTVDPPPTSLQAARATQAVSGALRASLSPSDSEVTFLSNGLSCAPSPSHSSGFRAARHGTDLGEGRCLGAGEFSSPGPEHCGRGVIAYTTMAKTCRFGVRVDVGQGDEWPCAVG